MDPVSPSSGDPDGPSAPSGSSATANAFESIADLCSNFEFVGIADCQTLAFQRWPPSHTSLEPKKDPVTFLSLPRELRDIIYDFATKDVEVHLGRKKLSLRNKKGETRSSQTKSSPSLPLASFGYGHDRSGKRLEREICSAALTILPQSSMSATNSGLLLTSKQVRCETVSLYLRNTLFTFLRASTAADWIKSIPLPLRESSLQHIRLSIASKCYLDVMNRRKRSRERYETLAYYLTTESLNNKEDFWENLGLAHLTIGRGFQLQYQYFTAVPDDESDTARGVVVAEWKTD
ncbi:uncharacterized protein RHO25_007511 [Cercospora beticola]|uniref:DUF7730 domain-containing protein n=1 Tax=Cercospora beticola TaxID=122368 RepID=A0ABZ0NTL2_CERBT|nr:hypothetical protein RHO25_007511 [Cercospora beticola]